MKKILIYIFFATSILIAEPYFSQCKDPQSTHEIRQCNAEMIAYYDKQLNTNYRKALQRLTEDEQKRLQKAQRAWIVYRDAMCDVHAAPMRNGSFEAVLFEACIVNMTKKQARELEKVGTE